MSEKKISPDLSGDAAIPDASWLLSGVYGMLIVVLSMVICSSHYITPDVSEVTVDVYFIFLSVVGTIWLFAFRTITVSCTREKRAFLSIKSAHSTNRWLKGILIVFGIAIIIKDVLEFLTYFEYDDGHCKKVVYYLAPVAQIFFIIAEVNFLFRYSKLHLQQHKQLGRFATMHVIATNLSIWMLIIIDESMSESHNQIVSYTHTTAESFTTPSSHVLEKYDCNTTEIQKMLNSNQANSLGPSYSQAISEPLFEPEDCICNTTYCAAVSTAHTFLYPFLVEFSLVASCMMYIVWKNVGTFPKHTGPAVKPVYKFYKSYKGLVLGSLALVVTVVVLIFINNTDSDIPESERTYDTETTNLIICNSFMVGIEVIMIIGCILGLALFRVEPRPLAAVFNLDVVLLLVTITGTAILDMYYAFAVYTGFITDKEDDDWIWGAVYPVVDLLQCIIQVGFLLAGFARKPIVEKEGEKDSSSTSNPPSYESTDLASDSGIPGSYTNEVFVGEDQMVIEVPTDLAPVEKAGESIAVNKEKVETEEESEEACVSAVAITKFSICPSKSNGDVPDGVLKTAVSNCAYRKEKALEDRIRRHNERPKVAPPNKLRLYIRDTVMFLLIANACLWMFWSIEGTTFKLFTYPYKYYTTNDPTSRNMWHTATMFCLPLSIFFRMHSCACLFELWSFT